MSQHSQRTPEEPPPEVAVVVPVKDEAENLLPLIDEIEAALSGFARFEVVYVDDGSEDDTPSILRAARTTRPWLRVLRHARSYGQSQAVATGVRHARAPLVATLDGDGQNDPADLPRMLEILRSMPAAERERVMVAGKRQKRKDDALRRLSSRIANGVRARLLRDDTPDSGCGIKLFPRAAFRDLPYFDHMHRFLPALMLRGGGKVVSVPVRHRPRQRGTSKYGVWNRLWVGIVDILGVMWLQRRAAVPVVQEVP